MARANPIKVEVAYALPEIQVIVPLKVEEGATAEDAIRKSGILDRFPEIDLAKAKVGVFGKLVKLDSPLRPKDRVEIYRPLKADPKEVRKRRAVEGKAMKKGGGSEKTE
ncbi:RnfH family protein [Thiohalomonas denitrificans]|uniref:RnfH family protein n=1 Tax=Thiohalomonas denitrificans TaxID=415747 RepID=UPI0026EDC9DC|nr:RnfH family protein [Thiohalomonas denitrificans]